MKFRILSRSRRFLVPESSSPSLAAALGSISVKHFEFEPWIFLSCSRIRFLALSDGKLRGLQGIIYIGFLFKTVQVVIILHEFCREEGSWEFFNGFFFSSKSRECVWMSRKTKVETPNPYMLCSLCDDLNHWKYLPTHVYICKSTAKVTVLFGQIMGKVFKSHISRNFVRWGRCNMHPNRLINPHEVYW